MSPGGPAGPSDPLAPEDPCKPGKPCLPGELGIPDDFLVLDGGNDGSDIMLDGVESTVEEVVMMSFAAEVLGLARDLSGLDVAVSFAMGTSNTVYAKENKSDTTTQTLSKLAIDSGSGFNSEPKVSENVPSRTRR